MLLHHACNTLCGVLQPHSGRYHPYQVEVVVSFVPSTCFASVHQHSMRRLILLLRVHSRARWPCCTLASSTHLHTRAASIYKQFGAAL